MIRLEFLLNEVRESTDIKGKNSIKDSEIISYYNDGARYIQNIIFKNNVKADIFKGVMDYESNTTGIYDLPEDIFAVNALSAVKIIHGNHIQTLNNIDESEEGSNYGYYTQDNQLHLSGIEWTRVGKVRIVYFKALPRFDKRWGKINAVSPGTITLDAGYDNTAQNINDHITIVDSKGLPIISGIEINAFADNVWSTSSDLTGVAAGQYVCMGKRASNYVTLPEASQTYLKDYVRQRLYTRNNYADANKQVFFTNQQELDLVGLFSKNTKDNHNLPITDTTFLEF